jgi:glutamine amidotransferase
MCELLGMNCNVPTDICFSFRGFTLRGGRTGHHTDGFGIAFFEDRGCRVFLDYEPSAASPIAELIRNYPIKSTNVIAHIRKATVGEATLANCHPFQREMWGRNWLFAHNGTLENLPALRKNFYRPVGATDSEHAFCLILETLRERYPEPPGSGDLVRTIIEVTRAIAGHGIFNYILSDGELMLAHCATQLHYIVRQAPFSHAHLVDEDLTVDFADLTTPEDRVSVIATQPLTDNETWTAMAPGELIVFKDGAPAAFPARDLE